MSPTHYTLILFAFITSLTSCKLKTSGLFSQEKSNLVELERYNQMCSEQNVPLPDRPQSDKLYWPPELKRVFPIEFPHFAAFNKGTILYTHTNPDNSGCMLAIQNRQDYPEDPTIDYGPQGKPKVTSDGTGAICWSATGAVCFWEDIEAPLDLKLETSNYLITNRESTLHPFTPPPTKVQPCTECHMGENPFVAHGDYGSPVLAELPKVKFTSVVGNPKGWGMRAPREDIRCSGACHTMPDPSYESCSIALRMMESGYMLGREFGLSALEASTKEAPDKTACERWGLFIDRCGELELAERNSDTGTLSQDKNYPLTFQRRKETMGKCL